MDQRMIFLYQLLAALPRHTVETPASSLPTDGIYFFYEEGEQIRLGGRCVRQDRRVPPPFDTIAQPVA
jgi:hypothetical protein